MVLIPNAPSAADPTGPVTLCQCMKLQWITPSCPHVSGLLDRTLAVRSVIVTGARKTSGHRKCQVCLAGVAGESPSCRGRWRLGRGSRDGPGREVQVCLGRVVELVGLQALPELAQESVEQVAQCCGVVVAGLSSAAVVH